MLGNMVDAASSSKPKLPAPMKPWASPEGHGSSHISVEWAMPPASLEPVEYEVQVGGRLMGKWTTARAGMEEDPKSEMRRIPGLKPNEKHLVPAATATLDRQLPSS